ncbi:hypothetical protein [uncultured Enterococcus sp.]|uniref:hypothetical protein n=1 Tax=uncultured Enterococcus sp. TaxID=167972 RepID=UPI00259AA865|nr:hypothetical protein [uncultured Enterococcus sp.]
MIYQIHTGEVINVETLEDIRGWLTDDIYEIATDLMDEKTIEIKELEKELEALESANSELEQRLKNISKLCKKYMNEVETNDLTKRQLMTRVKRIWDKTEI